VTLPKFELPRPKTLPEALQMLSVTPDAMPIAGGTNLIPDLRKGINAPGTLVDVSELAELCCIRRKDGHLLIGGGVKIAELLDDPMVARDAPILCEMARSFANALIRNRATIGGNLVNAAPCCDSAAALLALDAEVELASTAGTRQLPLAEFLVDAFTTKRQSNELLTCVRVPIPPKPSYGGFVKMGLRKISCMAKIDVAVMVEANGDGTCTSARIALGAVSPVAYRARAAEEYLAGRALAGETIRETARLAGAPARPREGSEYKLQVVRALTKRLLEGIGKRIAGSES
jgi:CO/xanthine dehydrogenase FAD-binding subunit